MSAKRTAATGSEGFTIIEVLIVLAIAGIIMLIVFLAIPALQRSSRNNQRKQDVAAILQAVSHYELSNSGNVPDASHKADWFNYAKLTYYTDSSAVSGVTSSKSTLTQNPVSDVDKVQLYNYAKCDADVQGQATHNGAGYNDVVALYAVETSNTPTPQCEQL